MADRNETEWAWWAGRDDEFFTVGPCTSREEAISAAVRDGCCEDRADDGEGFVNRIYLVEAQNAPLRLADFIDVEQMIERADEDIGESDRVSYEFGDEPPYFDPTPEQTADLTQRVKAAVEAWQDAHGITVTTCTFSATRNREFVVLPAPEKAA